MTHQSTAQAATSPSVTASLDALIGGFDTPHATMILDGTHTERGNDRPGVAVIAHLRWRGPDTPDMAVVTEYLENLPIPTACALAFGHDLLVGMVFTEGTIEDLDTLDDEVMWLHYYSGCETDPRLLGERTLRVTYLDLVDTVLGTGATVAPEETPSVLLSVLLYQHLGVPLLKFRALGIDRCPVPGFIHWCQNDYFFCAHDAWFEGNRPMLETHR